LFVSRRLATFRQQPPPSDVEFTAPWNGGIGAQNVSKSNHIKASQPLAIWYCYQQTVNKLMNTKACILACAAGILSTSAFADFSAQEREIHVKMSVSRTSIEDVDTTLISGELNYGYFFTNSFEGLVGGTFNHADYDYADSSVYGFMTGGRYHFNNGTQWTPFVGAKIAFIKTEMGDFNHDEWAYGGECGIRHRINENIALDYALEYLRTNDTESGNIAFSLGLGFIF
jgi:hypothetical protein